MLRSLVGSEMCIRDRCNKASYLAFSCILCCTLGILQISIGGVLKVVFNVGHASYIAIFLSQLCVRRLCARGGGDINRLLAHPCSPQLPAAYSLQPYTAYDGYTRHDEASAHVRCTLKGEQNGRVRLRSELSALRIIIIMFIDLPALAMVSS